MTALLIIFGPSIAFLAFSVWRGYRREIRDFFSMRRGVARDA